MSCVKRRRAKQQCYTATLSHTLCKAANWVAWKPSSVSSHGPAMALAAFAKDKGVRWVLLGWSIFTAENLVMPLSPSLRAT